MSGAEADAGAADASTAPTTVHNLRTDPMGEGDVRIDRRTVFGNPFVLGRDGDRDRVIGLYRADLWRRIRAHPGFRARVRELRGRRLFCWCAPLECHGTTLAAAAEWLAGVPESAFSGDGEFAPPPAPERRAAAPGGTRP